MDDERGTDQRARRSLYLALAVIGAVQGGLYYLVDHSLREHAEAGVAVAAFATGAGFTAVFAWAPYQWHRLALVSMGIGSVYAALGWSAAHSLGVGSAEIGGVAVGGAFTRVVTAVIGLAILVPAAQAFVRHGVARWSYEELFLATCNAPLALGVGGAMFGVSWGLLQLWAYLFEIVGIDAISNLITERAFGYVFSCTMVAVGIAVARDNARVTAAIRTILLGACWLLIPPMTIFAVVFLLNLPISGLVPLSRHASVAVVVLAQAIATVLLVNGVFQYGERTPAGWFRAIAYAAIATVPLLAMIGGYAAGLRIGQHGLSDDRFVLAIVVIVVAACGLSYAGAVVLDLLATLRGKPQWLAALPRINIAMAIAVLIIAAFINTPVLDPVRWSVQNQVARLERGAVSARTFDYGYLRFKAGRYGREALERLARMANHPEADAIAEEIMAVRLAPNYWRWQSDRRPSAIAN